MSLTDEARAFLDAHRIPISRRPGLRREPHVVPLC